MFNPILSCFCYIVYIYLLICYSKNIKLFNYSLENELILPIQMKLTSYNSIAKRYGSLNIGPVPLTLAVNYTTPCLPLSTYCKSTRKDLTHHSNEHL